MTDPAGRIAGVFNGCVYNYKELRAELRALGHRFFSGSDTEVVLKAYQQWGTDCVDRFYGMFAFVIVEQATGRLVLARDRLGIKPLYLAQAPGRLRFASSLPALLAGGGIDTSLDPVALHQYMSWHATVAAPRTVLAGVHKLPAATVRVVEPDGRHRDIRYWQPSYTRRPQDAQLGADDWRDAVLDALRTAVQPAHGRRRARGCPPVGRPGLQPDRGTAGRRRAARSCDVQRGLRVRGRRGGRRVPLLRPGRPALRHGPPPADGALGPGVDGAGRRDRGDERADDQP